MARLRIKYVIAFFCIAAISCKHEPASLNLTSGGNYPGEVAKIILNKCATTGCHNNASHTGAGGLNLTTWDKLFEGGNTGAVLIPYRPDFSTLCFYTNTDTALGVTLIPTMPVNKEPLSKSEYLILKNWVATGAPDVKGRIKFSDNPSRKKIYITNQLCDVVTVFDAATKLQMRYVDVGNKPATEFPRTVKVSPDKKHWYVSFFSNTDIIQKFSATDDRLVGEINIGSGAWTSFEITADSKYGFFVDNNNPGKVAYVDLEHMQLLATYTFGGKFQYPSGIAINEELKTIYVGNTTGNYIYTIDIADPLHPVIKELIIDGSSTLLYNSSIDPTELVTDTATGYCYISCTGSAEIKVMNMNSDVVIHTIPIGSSPSHMSLSGSAKKLFVTCPNDVISFPGNRGSVVIIDIETNTVIKRINSGYQPFGIAVDDLQKTVTVVNANLSPDGNAPHHTTNCGGRNGNVTFIDMATMELIPLLRSEVAVYPYGAAAR